MDFHSLKRRDLQALCKKNKIPANLTNIAMADALAALDIVEEMEEFLNPSCVESPEKTEKASPCVPRTGGRTTTRRKPINEEPESVQILSRAPRGTRKAIAEEGNAKIDVDETLAVLSNRKKTVASSGFRKMETPRNQEEISGQKMYSRRSTRLLEKKMMDMNLNDAEGIKPIDFGGSDKEVPNEVEGNVKEDSDDLPNEVEGNVKEDSDDFPNEVEGNVKEDSDDLGLNQEGISDDLMETNLEDLVDKKSGDLSENARELEQTSEVLDETVNVLVSEENTVSLTPGLDEDVDDEVDNANKDDDGAGSEGCAESDILSGENLEKSLALKDEIPEEEDTSEVLDETVDVLVSQENTVSLTPGMVEDVDDEVDDANKDDDGSGSEGYAESNMLLGETLGKLASEDLGAIDFDTWKMRFSAAAEYQKQDIELQNQATIEFDMISVNDLGSTLTGEDKSKEDEKETTLVNPNCGEESDQLIIESGNEIDCPTVTVSHISSCSVIGENNASDSLTPQGITPLSRLTQLIDMALSTLAADPLPEQMSSNSDSVICPASVTPTKESGNLMGVNPSTLSLPTSDENPSAEVPIDMASSTLAPDPLPEQLLDDVIRPASVTPMKKSASKTPSLSRKINDLLDENKENIGNSSRKIHVTNEADAAASLTKKSLRQLKNMVKESGNLMGVNPSTLSLSSSDKTPGAEVPIDMASSTLAADPLPEQISHNGICPASVTPTKKSASKTPTLSRKINDHLDENKENIDNSSMKFHVTNKADAAVASLTKKSLRQLKNMVKKKMQVTSKQNILEEKDTAAKVGRPALQSLSENRLVASEPGNI